MDKKFILITGGELFNKGAQSMTFITVNELKKRFPENEVILMSSSDYKREEEYKNKYSFHIMPGYIIYKLIGGVYSLIWELKAKKQNTQTAKKLFERFKYIIKNTEMIVDISGYALSSQRGIGTSIDYLMRIKLAKKYGINVFLMPQSFGPFSYKGITKYCINHLIKKYLNYPKVIYAREQEGYEILCNNYKLKNVQRAHDLVLLNKEVNLSNIYINSPEINCIGSFKDIAIVPNMKNFKHGNFEEVLKIYDTCINKLTKLDKTVYLIRHSFEDIEACRLIKERFKQNDKVVFLQNDFSCIEYDYLVRKFDFIIASRYHSIIHAYKNGVPCIAIGWATKYRELLETFKQERYIFDVRGNINMFEFENAINLMLERYKEESKTIISTLRNLQKSNIFDILGGEN